MSETRYTDFTLYRRLLRQAQPYWLHISSIFLIGLLSSLLTLLIPLPMKIAVDSVIGSHPAPGFITALPTITGALSGAAILLFAAGFSVAIALLNQLQELGGLLLRTYTGER